MFTPKCHWPLHIFALFSELLFSWKSGNPQVSSCKTPLSTAEFPPLSPSPCVLGRRWGPSTSTWRPRNWSSCGDWWPTPYCRRGQTAWWWYVHHSQENGGLWLLYPQQMILYILLVVWNIFIFPYIGNVIIPNWRNHIFQRGRSTTNQQRLMAGWVMGHLGRRGGSWSPYLKLYEIVLNKDCHDNEELWLFKRPFTICW